MVLQAASEVCQLNCVDRSGDTPVFFGMYFFFTGVHEHAVAVNVALIFYRLIWLPSIVEGDGVGPYILPALPHFLSIVLPMNTMPEKVIVYAMLEASPYCCPRVGS